MAKTSLQTGVKSLPKSKQSPASGMKTKDDPVDEHATQTELPASENEVMDTITTPVFMKNANNAEETVTLVNKPQNYHVYITVHQARKFNFDGNLMFSLQMDTVKRLSSIKEATGNPKFNELFIFDFNTTPKAFFRKQLSLRAFQLRGVLRAARTIGHYAIDVSSVFVQENHQLNRKWLPLLDEEDKVQGFVQVDIAIVTSDSTIEGQREVENVTRDNIESNLFLSVNNPSATRRSVRYFVSVYSADGLSNSKQKTGSTLKKLTKGQKLFLNPYVAVSLDGFQAKTSVQKHTRNPNWNETIAFNGTFPSLSQNLKIKLCSLNGENSEEIATHSLKLTQISDDSADEKGFLPTFGPSYVYFYGSPKSKGKPLQSKSDECVYCGRLLIALRTQEIQDTGLQSAETTVTDVNQNDLSNNVDHSTPVKEEPESFDDNKVNVEGVMNEKEPLIDVNGEVDDVSQAEEALESDSIITENAPSVTKLDAEDLKTVEPDVSVEKAEPLSTKSGIAREEEFMFFAVLYESNLIAKKFQNNKLSYEVTMCNTEEGLGNSMFNLSIADSVSLSRQSLADKETWSSPESQGVESSSPSNTLKRQPTSEATPFLTEKDENGSTTLALKPVSTDEKYLHLPYQQEKPCLYTKAYLPDHRRRLYHSNVILRIADELEIGLADVESLSYLRRKDTYRRLQGVLQELVVGCNRFFAVSLSTRYSARSALDKRRNKHRVKLMENISDKAMKMIPECSKQSYANIMRSAYQWLIQLRDVAEEAQSTFPQIFIWMISDQKRVAFCKLHPQDYIFSLVDEDRGKLCGKRHSLIFRSLKDPRQINCQLEIHAWFGPSKYKSYFTDAIIKGYEISDEIANADLLDVPPPRTLKYKTSHQVQLRSHILQAVFAPQQSKLLNPYVKVTFGGQSGITHTLSETLSPMWNVMLLLPDLTIYGEPKDLSRHRPTLTLEIYDKDFKTGQSHLVGRCFPKCNLRFKDESYNAPKLEWFDLWSADEFVGIVWCVFEVIQLSDTDDLMQYPMALPAKANVENAPEEELYCIPSCIKPAQSEYKLEVLFVGLRDIKGVNLKNVEFFRVDVELAGHMLSSTGLRDVQQNANFVNPLQSLNVEIPDQDIYCPPLTIRVVYRTPSGLSLLGTHTIPYIMDLAYQSPTDESLSPSVIHLNPTEFLLDSNDCRILDNTNEESCILWWKIYKASKSIKVEDGFELRDENGNLISQTIPEMLQLKTFDAELEKSAEFGNSSSWGLSSYPLFSGRKLSLENEPPAAGIFKGSIQLYNNSVDISPAPEFDGAVEPVDVLVRVYIVEAENLSRKSAQHKVNPYLNFLLSGKKASDKDNHRTNQRNPVFGKCYEFEATFPNETMLTIQMMDHDKFGSDTLIGETTIDLENRYYSRHLMLCGLPKVYKESGPLQWRDALKPFEILKKLCTDLKVEEPEFGEDYVKVRDCKFMFNVDKKINTQWKEEISLAILHRWKDVFGYSLLPMHVEKRYLYNPRKANVHSGCLSMWVDMFPKTVDSIPPPIDIAPRKQECFVLRVIVKRLSQLRLKDITFLSGVKIGSVYVRGSLLGVEDAQITECRTTKSGDFDINWRFIFPFDYITTERRIAKSNYRKHSSEEKKKVPPILNIDVLDLHYFKYDSTLGKLQLNLDQLVCPSKATKNCTLDLLNSDEKMNIFRNRAVTGWWPLERVKNDEHLLAGKIELEMELLTKEEADSAPAGFGRNPPQELEKPRKSSKGVKNSLKTLRKKVPFVGKRKNLSISMGAKLDKISTKDEATENIIKEAP